MTKNKNHPSIIVEDFVGSSYANRMYKLVSGPTGFPWNFNPVDVTYGDNPVDPTKNKIGFTHSLLLEGQVTEYLNLFVPLLDDIQDLVKVPCNFTRLRLALHPQNINADLHNTPHTDYQDDHYSAIYYLNDSDGDTFLFNEYDNPNCGLTVEQRYQMGRNRKEYTIQKRVTPKHNKLLVFDGHQFHASSHPKESPYRIILNINFTTPSPVFSNTNGVGFKK